MASTMTIGDRIYQLRTDRVPKLTQKALAERAGVSIDVVAKLEQGRKLSASLESLTKLARALDVSLGEVVSRPGRLIGKQPEDPRSGLLGLRQMLTPLGVQASVDASEAEVAEAVRGAWSVYYVSSDFDTLTSIIPGLAADAQQFPNLLAETYRLAACLLSRVGVEDLAYLAGMKAVEAAGRSNNPLLVTVAQATNIWVYLNQGRPEEALEFATERIDTLEPRLGKAPVVETAVWGNLVVTGATAASRAGDTDTADEMLRLAGAAASVTGERVDYHTSFGPGQVVMQTVDAAVVRQDFPAALAAARSMPTESSLRVVSHARHLEDVAIAQTKLRRDAEAVETLNRMERLAPKWIRYEPGVRSIVAELVDRERRIKTPTLRQLAQRLGVA